MSHNDLRMKVARAIARLYFPEASIDDAWKDYIEDADAAISIIRPAVREEAAKVADDLGYECEGCGHLCGNPETDLAIIQKAGGISCCPERKMRPLGTAIRSLAKEGK